MKYKDFIDDIEKIADFLMLNRTEFLKFYPHLTSLEYDLTEAKFYQDTVLSLFNFIKQCKQGDFDVDTQFYCKIAYLEKISKLSLAQQKKLEKMLDEENLLNYNK